MVWLHGGGNYVGSGNWYHSSVLSSHNDIIVVTLNHRLALFGFLYISGTDLAGNYGYLDQVQALKWVHQNIGNFGGDPNSVTIFGESAGGASVHFHIMSPMSAGLFHKAIIQSGNANSNFAFHSPDSSDYDWIINELGCPDKKNLLRCLRTKKVEEFMKLMRPFSFRKLGFLLPVTSVDGQFVPDDPRNLQQTHQFNNLTSIMIGFTKDEAKFLSNDLNPMTFELFEKIVQHLHLYGDCEIVKKAVLHRYKNHTNPQENMYENIARLFGDMAYFAPSVLTADSFSSAGIPTYMYQFSHRSSFSNFPEWLGVPHFDELQYLFGSPWQPNPRLDSASRYSLVERGLSSYVMALWTGFAKDRIPDGLVTWPRYTSARQEYINIGLAPSIHHHFQADRIAFWNKFVPLLAKHCREKENKK
ncbi:acetylcholinesterase isoform X1 [Nematostella vectensis]|uniref:acetylcholinesterase isoform X1 n=1 Tax=Nematostella vectensis TaxID=45351 RepID=UPI0020777B4A|nr:acetylcholinesterase isoform X1 [Nematostella vectensis]